VHSFPQSPTVSTTTINQKQQNKIFQDADVMSVMNIQSSRNQDALLKLQYYMVPTVWLRRAWPLLSGQVVVADHDDDDDTERERVGEIPCRELLLLSTTAAASASAVNGSVENRKTGTNNNNIIQVDDDDDDGDWQHVQWQEPASSPHFLSKQQQKWRTTRKVATNEDDIEPSGYLLTIDMQSVEKTFLDSTNHLKEIILGLVEKNWLPSMLSLHCQSYHPSFNSCVGISTESHVVMNTCKLKSFVDCSDLSTGVI